MPEDYNIIIIIMVVWCI